MSNLHIIILATNIFCLTNYLGDTTKTTQICFEQVTFLKDFTHWDAKVLVFCLKIIGIVIIQFKTDIIHAFAKCPYFYF